MKEETMEERAARYARDYDVATLAAMCVAAEARSRRGGPRHATVLRLREQLAEAERRAEAAEQKLRDLYMAAALHSDPLRGLVVSQVVQDVIEGKPADWQPVLDHVRQADDAARRAAQDAVVEMLGGAAHLTPEQRAALERELGQYVESS